MVLPVGDAFSVIKTIAGVSKDLRDAVNQVSTTVTLHCLSTRMTDLTFASRLTAVGKQKRYLRDRARSDN